MAQFTPHYNLFAATGRIQSANSIIFWIILFLSAYPFARPYVHLDVSFDDLANTLNIILIGAFFILDIIADLVMIPQADNKRRDDFIDNAFGSTFSPNPSVGYYSTVGIQPGLYKAAANLFENSLFTLSLLRLMTVKKIVLPAVVLVTVFVLAYYGFRQAPIALSILQSLFSANLLGDLIKHILHLSKLNHIQDDWIALFQQSDFKSNPTKYQAFVFRYWLQYETLISKIPANIPDSLFKKHNTALSTEWDNLKTRYNIN